MIFMLNDSEISSFLVIGAICLLNEFANLILEQWFISHNKCSADIVSKEADRQTALQELHCIKSVQVWLIIITIINTQHTSIQYFNFGCGS